MQPDKETVLSIPLLQKYNPLEQAMLPRSYMPRGIFKRRLPRGMDVDLLRTGDFNAMMHRLAADRPNVQVAKLGESDGVLFEEFDGLSRYSGRRASGPRRPLLALEYAALLEKKALLFIVAGHHGTEPAGPAAVIEFARHLAASNTNTARFLRAYFQICLVPVVDVDNFSRPLEARTYSSLNNFYHCVDDDKEELRVEGSVYRVQSAGPEARAVASALRVRMQKGLPTLTFDLHEIWAKPDYGFYIAQWPESQKKGWDKSALKSLGRAALPCTWTRNNFYSYPCSWGGISFSEYTEKLGGLSFTLESPRYRNTSDSRVRAVSAGMRVEMHLRAIDAITRKFASEL